MKRERSRPAIPQYLQKAPSALQSLWLERWITSLDEFRSHYDKPVVALDIEVVHGESSEITSFGFAIIRNLATKLNQATETPADFTQLVEKFEIEGYNVVTCSHRTGNRNRFERSPLAKMRWVEMSDVEKTLEEILQTVNNFTLVVYTANAEFRAMAAAFPTLVRRIARWLDLAHIVADMTGTRKNPFSLRDVMMSIGFESHLQGHRSHSAGMDAVRTMGVLLTA